MNKNRLDQLLSFLKEDPQDPFTIYAIANEYKSAEMYEDALPYYRRLVEEHEQYTGTYYHFAEVLSEIGEREQAEQIYLKGIKVCQREADHHALRELQNAYNNFLFDDE